MLCMIVDEVRIPYKYGETIKLMPLFDIHYDGMGNKGICDVAKLKADLELVDDNTYIIGGGDWLECIVPGDKRYRKGLDNSESEEIIDEQLNGLYEIFKPYRERILWIGDGNHEDSVIKYSGTNPMKRLAERLSTDQHTILYTGYNCFISLRLNENGARTRTVKVYCHHGWGGGSRTQGADLTKYSKHAANIEADLFLYGHVHRRQQDELPRLTGIGKKFIAKPKRLLICGAYKKTFSNTAVATFAERLGFQPSRIGCMFVNIKPTAEWVEMSVVS